MKKHYLTLFAIVASIPLVAADFVVDGLAYNILDATNKTVEVTFTGDYHDYYGDIVIPESVTYNNILFSVVKIGDNAFAVSGLTSILIPNSVTCIGRKAFDRSSVQLVTIPSSLVNVKEYAFDGCSRLVSVHISDIAAWCNIDFEGEYGADSNPLNSAQHLYLNNQEVTELIIPLGVEKIKNKAFCGGENISSIQIPNSVKSIGSSAFEYCSSLASITLPNSIESIGGSAFGGCENLTSIKLSDRVGIIESAVFWGCKKLSSIVIPQSVKTIKSSAFSNCTGIDTITMTGISAPSIDNTAFSGLSKFIPIIVPCGTKDAYQATAGLSAFLNIQEAETFPYAITVTTADSLKGTAQVNVQADCDKDAIISAKAKEGFTFSRWSDGNNDNPRSLTLTNDVSLTAYFNPTQCVVKVLSDGGGTAIGSDTVPYNSACTISATPNKYHHFLKWSDGSTANPRSVVVKQDTCFTAIFEHDELEFVHYTIINESPYGTMTVTGEAVKGSTITLNAIAPECSKFVRWSDSRSAPNPRTITITSDATFTAIFEKVNFTITLDAGEKKGEVVEENDN